MTDQTSNQVHIINIFSNFIPVRSHPFVNDRPIPLKVSIFDGSMTVFCLQAIASFFYFALDPVKPVLEVIGRRESHDALSAFYALTTG